VTVRSGLYLLLGLALFAATDAPPAPTTAARELPAPILVAAADDEVTVNVLELGVNAVDVDRKDKLMTLHFVSSVTTRYRVLAAVDRVVATIP